jgi:hypothetical protein
MKKQRKKVSKPKVEQFRHHHVRVFLVVSTTGHRHRYKHTRIYQLHPNRRTNVMTSITVGHTDTLTIAYLDAAGNPMLVTPTPDSPPTWTNTPSTPPVDTFTVAADGNSATVAATAAGSDVVNLSVVVGGKTFTASDAITISAAPQVLTSVAIVDTVA